MKKVSAKPIVWEMDDDAKSWSESSYGFYINLDPEEMAPYTATWGEVEVEHFTTLDAAQAWCQEQIDHFISTHAVVSES